MQHRHDCPEGGTLHSPVPRGTVRGSTRLGREAGGRKAWPVAFTGVPMGRQGGQRKQLMSAGLNNPSGLWTVGLSLVVWAQALGGCRAGGIVTCQ